MNLRRLVFLLIGLCFSFSASGEEAKAGSVTAELAEMETLSEVMRHLYRWNLDETDFEGVSRGGDLDFLIQSTHPELDEGDRSLYAEIFIPSLSTLVLMKKTDYTIEELAVDVRSDRFKIVNVEKSIGLSGDEADAMDVKIPVGEMMDYLFKTRSQPDFPSRELSMRLKHAIADEIADYREKAKEGPQTVFVAPLSPVANEIWAYWQEENLLVRWSSDIDLNNPAVWEHESLATKTIDIDQQAVVAASEAPGSNAYYTRDQIGRILYNCVVLGQKRTPVLADGDSGPSEATGD